MAGRLGDFTSRAYAYLTELSVRVARPRSASRGQIHRKETRWQRLRSALHHRRALTASLVWRYDVTWRIRASRQLPFRSGFIATSDRPNPLSIGAPPESLGLGDTCTTSLRLRAGRFATVEAATRLAWLRSDLAAAAGPKSWLRKGAGPCDGLAMAGWIPTSCPGPPSKTP